MAIREEQVMRFWRRWMTIVFWVSMSGHLHAQGALPEWTYMNYMMGDTQDVFGKWCIQEMAKMAAAGGSAQVSVVCQVDAKEFETAYGCKRFHLTGGQANEVGRLGQVNMAAASTLRDFLVWVKENYPARRFALVLTGHSRGWNGLGWDMGKKDTLHLHELKDALAGAGIHLDVVAFKAPFMASVEVAHQLRGLADWMVASQNIARTPIWEHQEVLERLKRQPSAPSQELGLAIRDSFERSTHQEDRTLSVVDVRAIAGVVAGVDGLVQKMILHLGTDREAFVQVRSNLRGMLDQSSQGGYSFATHVDLVDLLGRLEGALPGEISSAAGELRRRLQAAILANVRGSLVPHASGVSIYFPATPSEMDGNYDPCLAEPGAPGAASYQVPDFVSGTAWPRFLLSYYAGGSTADPHEPDGSFCRAHAGLTEGEPHRAYIWQTFESDAYRLAASGALSLSMEKPPGRDFDLKLWSQDGQLIKLVHGADEGTLRLDHPEAVPGKVYYLVVRGFGDRDRESPYVLTASGIGPRSSGGKPRSLPAIRAPGAHRAARAVEDPRTQAKDRRTLWWPEGR
jgi:hypothetical protein